MQKSEAALIQGFSSFLWVYELIPYITSDFPMSQIVHQFAGGKEIII
jgi:hypothetical protein